MGEILKMQKKIEKQTKNNVDFSLGLEDFIEQESEKRKSWYGNTKRIAAVLFVIAIIITVAMFALLPRLVLHSSEKTQTEMSKSRNLEVEAEARPIQIIHYEPDLIEPEKFL